MKTGWDELSTGNFLGYEQNVASAGSLSVLNPETESRDLLREEPCFGQSRNSLSKVYLPGPPTFTF